jgi:hypothetical protein
LVLLSFSSVIRAEPHIWDMTLLSDLTLGLGWRGLLIVVLSGPFVYWIGWSVYARFLHPLANIPGPLWPSVSRTWLMYRMYKGDLEFHMRAIHDRYRILAQV